MILKMAALSLPMTNGNGARAVYEDFYHSNYLLNFHKLELGSKIMKTAISVQSNLFQRAEKFAREKKISRSKLFSDAVKDYLDRHERERIIEQINKVCDEVDTSIDPFWKEIQGRVISKDEW